MHLFFRQVHFYLIKFPKYFQKVLIGWLWHQTHGFPMTRKALLRQPGTLFHTFNWIRQNVKVCMHVFNVCYVDHIHIFMQETIMKFSGMTAIILSCSRYCNIVAHLPWFNPELYVELDMFTLCSVSLSVLHVHVSKHSIQLWVFLYTK